MSASPSLLRFGLVLGAVTALGPLAIDMYLPALPTIMRELATEEGPAQQSVMIFFLGLTAGQLVYGPLSDTYGRKAILFLGLAVFVAGAIGCAFAHDISSLIGFRFMQGAGGCIGMIMGSAITRDLHTGHAAVRLLSTIILVLGVAPVLAPLAGSAIIATNILGQETWRLIFLAHVTAALLCMIVVAIFLPETRAPEARAALRLSHAAGTYARLLRDRRFMGLVFLAGTAQAGFFCYLAGSSFAFIGVYGLAPAAYSILFGLNAVGLIGGAQVMPLAVRRFGAVRVVRTATALYATTALLLCAVTFLGLQTLPLLAALLFVCVGALAFILSPTAMLALQPQGAVAGTASALLGAMQFGCGAAASAVMGFIADNTTRPMVGMIGLCSLLACILSWRVRLDVET